MSECSFLQLNKFRKFSREDFKNMKEHEKRSVKNGGIRRWGSFWKNLQGWVSAGDEAFQISICILFGSKNWWHRKNYQNSTFPLIRSSKKRIFQPLLSENFFFECASFLKKQQPVGAWPSTIKDAVLWLFMDFFILNNFCPTPALFINKFFQFDLLILIWTRLIVEN